MTSVFLTSVFAYDIDLGYDIRFAKMSLSDVYSAEGRLTDIIVNLSWVVFVYISGNESFHAGSLLSGLLHVGYNKFSVTANGLLQLLDCCTAS